MLPYTHFTLNERKYLQELLSEGYSFRKIAGILGRNPSSISREIRRNRSRYPHKPSDNVFNYHAWRAQTLYITRRRTRAPYALNTGTPAWEYVITGLQNFWSPEEICGRWKLENPNEKSLHFSTLYRYIKAGRFPDIRRKTHLRRRGKRYQTRNALYNSIQPERIIPDWPDDIRNRVRLGD